MKRGLIVLGVCLVLALIRLGCGSSTVITNCANVSGNYAITKTVAGVSATKGGIDVTIENGATTVLPTQSSLSMTQTGCPLIATETIPNLNNLVIPYAGEANNSSGFWLKINNPDALAIPLQLKILGVTYTCKFNGSINWDGRYNNNSLSGTIIYTLAKRTDETNPVCPDACTVNMDFTGVRH